MVKIDTTVHVIAACIIACAAFGFSLANFAMLILLIFLLFGK